MMSELIGERSQSSRLPAYMRQRWQAAVPAERRLATTRRTQPCARLRWVYAAAALSAVGLLVLTPLAFRRWQAPLTAPQVAKQPAPQKRVTAAGQPRLEPEKVAGPNRRDAGEIALSVIDPADQLSSLEQQVVQLASDVDQIAEASQKLVVEQQINELLRRHSDW